MVKVRFRISVGIWVRVKIRTRVAVRARVRVTIRIPSLTHNTAVILTPILTLTFGQNLTLLGSIPKMTWFLEIEPFPACK